MSGSDPYECGLQDGIAECPGLYIGTPHCPACLAWMKRHGIRTNFDFPPIPVRGVDWSAVRDGYEPGEPIGRGSTEADAVQDLIEQEAA